MSDTGPTGTKRVLTAEQIKKLREEKKRRAILAGAASRISTITSGSIETEREALQGTQGRMLTVLTFPEMLRAPEEPASTTPHEHLPQPRNSQDEHKPQTLPTQTQTKTHTKPQNNDQTPEPKPAIKASTVSFTHKTYQLLWSIVFSFIFVLYGQSINTWISPLALAVLVHGGIELYMKRNWVDDNSTGDALWWLSTALALYNYSRSLSKDMCLSLFLSVVFGSVLQGLF